MLVSVSLGFSQLTQEEYQTHLGKRHVFVIACVDAGAECDKVQNDFGDEWESFNDVMKSEFESNLFLLQKTADNTDFFNSLTNNSTKNVVIYVEQEETEIKQFMNPQLMSLRAMREWMNDLETLFADKKINRKIEELDKMINDLKDPNFI